MSDDLFTYRRLNAHGYAKIHNVNNSFSILLDNLKKIVPDGRHLAIVKTKLEEAVFFAHKGIALHIDNQEKT